LFVDIAEQANKLTSTDAVEALAAFLREALAKAAETRNISARSGGLSPDGARVAVEEFIRYDAVDRPQRLQAFAAACFGLVYDEVKTRRLNDPSRDVPGDVQVLSGGTTVIAVEVRGKPVTAAELGTFVAACRDAGLSRAIMFVDAPKQTDLTSHASVLGKVQPAVHAAVFGSVSQLLADSILWSPLPLDEAVQKFTSSFLARLVEIEATTQTLQEWSRTVAVARAR
jgi:SacI restriction endonuclease